jgi:hypothetical protein
MGFRVLCNPLAFDMSAARTTQSSREDSSLLCNSACLRYICRGGLLSRRGKIPACYVTPLAFDTSAERTTQSSREWVLGCNVIRLPSICPLGGLLSHRGKILACYVTPLAFDMSAGRTTQSSREDSSCNVYPNAEHALA